MYQAYLSYFAEEISVQSEAIQAFARVAMRASDGHEGGSHPLSVVLVAGPLGSGKRTLMEALARLLLGSDRRVIKINPSLFPQAGHLLTYLASACQAFDATLLPGENPLRLIFVNPIEKSQPAVMELFIDIFTNGEAMLVPGWTVDFRRTIFVLETDVGELETGEELFLGFKASDPEAVAKEDARFRKTIEERVYASFPPRLLSLVDEFVFFRKIREWDLRSILEKLLRTLRQRLTSLGLHLHVEDAASNFLLSAGNRSLRFGTKGLRQAVDRHLETPLRDLLASRPLPTGAVIYARRTLNGIALFVPL
ncbi:MAG: ATP-dependent Clp protease ATP-binding subunit [Planctomycetes bacterium]|nr:ATP-dependent Clp protease ATP-binding subunit [Planctomycetota bacterium]